MGYQSGVGAGLQARWCFRFCGCFTSSDITSYTLRLYQVTLSSSLSLAAAWCLTAMFCTWSNILLQKLWARICMFEPNIDAEGTHLDRQRGANQANRARTSRGPVSSVLIGLGELGDAGKRQSLGAKKGFGLRGLDAPWPGRRHLLHRHGVSSWLAVELQQEIKTSTLSRCRTSYDTDGSSLLSVSHRYTRLKPLPP